MSESSQLPPDRNLRLHDPERFGCTVESLRVALGLDRVQLAERAGVSPKTLISIEKGRRDRRQQATVIRLAEALETTYEELLQAAGELPAAGREAAADTSPRASGQDRAATVSWRRRAAVLAVVVLVVMTLLVAWAATRPPAVVPTLAVEDQRLVARHPATGATMWRLATGSRIRLARPLPGAEGRVLVGLGLEATDAGWCLLLDRRTGDVLWRYRPDPQTAADVFARPEMAVDGGFGMNAVCFPDLDGDGEREIVAHYMHNRWFPSVLCHLDPEDGGLLASYWNWGRIYDPLVADLDDDGKDEMVWTATSNVPEYQGASVLLFDEHCRRGASFDAVSGGRADLPDSARVRLVIPAFERGFMDHVGKMRLKATGPMLREGPEGPPRIEIRVSPEGSRSALVTLDAELRPIAAVPSDPLRMVYAAWRADQGAPEFAPIEDWLADWLAGARRFEAGHWPAP